MSIMGNEFLGIDAGSLEGRWTIVDDAGRKNQCEMLGSVTESRTPLPAAQTELTLRAEAFKSRQPRARGGVLADSTDTGTGHDS